jgi:predicted DNA-binding transcriptional regulator YafY
VPDPFGGGEAYYLPEENFYLPDLDLTADEMTTLRVALALLDGHFAYARPLRLALACLSPGGTDPRDEELTRVAVALAPDDEARSAGSHLAAFEDAVSRGKTVRFGYRGSTGGDEAARILDPYGLFRIGGHWYAVGRDHDRDAIRTFRLGRIIGVVRFATKNPRDFLVPAEFDPEEYRARPPWLLGAPQGQARVAIGEDLCWWVERTYPHLTLEDPSAGGADGHRVLITPYADETALIGWVISLGGQAELLEPPELRQALAQRLERIRAAHAG